MIITLCDEANELPLGRIIDIIRRTLVPSGGVEERAVKSGIWVTLINVGDRALQFGKLIVLARLLSPSAIGLIGVALITLSVFEQFSRLGVDRALIQRDEDDVNEYLNTAWTINIVRGAIVVGIAFFAAPYVATFFGEPRSTDLIRVIALSTLLSGLRNPALVYFRKNLEFHKQFAYTLTGSTVNTAVTIGSALVFRSVWAFVFGRIAGNITMLLLSYAIHEYRPWPEFDRDLAAELIEYGKWILGSAMLLFLINQGDDGFVGWYLGAGALGLYQLGFRVSNAPSTEVTHVISNVVFPAYSRVQSDVSKLRDGYFRTVQVTTMISIPMVVGIIITAPTFVRGFLGEQWLPMILPMQILAVGGAMRSLDSSAGPLFEAIGRPDFNTKLQAVRLVLVALFIYPATDRWGIAGTALVIVGTGAVLSPLANYLAVRKVEGRLTRLARLLSYPLLGSAIMAAAVWAVRQNVTLGSAFLEFWLLAIVGGFVYVLAMAGVERQFDVGIEALVRRIISAIR